MDFRRRHARRRHGSEQNRWSDLCLENGAPQSAHAPVSWATRRAGEELRSRMSGSTAREQTAGPPFRQLKRLECKKCVGDPPLPTGRAPATLSTDDLDGLPNESLDVVRAAGPVDNR
ncbi:hypothetical protein GCM10028799_38900 [Kribbella italica]